MCPLYTLISDYGLQNCERIHIFYSKPPSWRRIVMAAIRNECMATRRADGLDKLGFCHPRTPHTPTHTMASRNKFYYKVHSKMFCNLLHFILLILFHILPLQPIYYSQHPDSVCDSISRKHNQRSSLRELEVHELEGTLPTSVHRGLSSAQHGHLLPFMQAFSAEVQREKE